MTFLLTPAPSPGVNRSNCELDEYGPPNLQGADLENADLKTTVFSFEPMNINVQGANFAGADLSSALDETAIGNASTRFRSATLTGALLLSSQLSGIDFSFVDLASDGSSYTALSVCPIESQKLSQPGGAK